MTESRKVVSSLSSQPHTEYMAQRHVTGFVSFMPKSLVWRISISKKRSTRERLVGAVAVGVAEVVVAEAVRLRRAVRL